MKPSIGKLDPRRGFWRRLAYIGARYGPELWLKHSPPVFGAVFAYAAPEARARVLDNLRDIRGKRSVLSDQADVLRTFVTYAHCLAESLAMERKAAHDRLEPARHDATLRQILTADRGLVVLTAHVGGWDTAAHLLVGGLGRDVIVVMQREPDSGARELHDSVRKRSGVRILHVGDHPTDALPLLRHLRQRGVVAAQLDRVPEGGRSLEVSLFGKPYSVPEGPFALAALAGVPVLPVFVSRRGYFDYAVEPGTIIELPRRPERAELVRVAQQATAEMERFIRSHPTQWFDFQSR